MNIVIVTQKDPFYIPLFFKNFFYIKNKNKNNINIKGVVIQKAIGSKSKFKLAKKMYNFFGLKNFIIQSIKYGINVIGKKLYKLGLIKKSRSIEFYVNENNINLLNYKNVNSQKFKNFIKKNNIDLIVSVSASQIFKKELLDLPKYGCINLHNAPLPEYRGMLPNFWQMYYGEEYSVLTIHEMVEELDKGRIIYQKKTKIENQMTLDELIKKTKINSAEALWEVLKKFENNKIEYKPLPEKKGSYFSFPTREDVKIFKDKGNKIL